MNISNPRRVSYLRASAYGPDISVRPRSFNVGNFHSVDFITFKAACEAERAAKPDYVDIESVIEPIPRPDSREKIRRMFTVYPYRDMGWLVSIVFMLGSIAFSINAGVALLIAKDPSAASAEKATVSLVSISTGSVLFLLVGFMGLLTAFNVDRRVIDLKVDDDGAYKPALIGSSEWVWWPTWLELRTVYLPNLAFRAGLVQLVGGIAFTVTAVAGLPGVIDLTDPSKILTFISAPQVIGGSMFLCASLILLFLAQDKWYRPKPLDASWQNGIWNTIGAIGFFTVGLISVLAPAQAVASASLFLLGGGSFFIGSLIQWYMIMEHYPS
ncbi:uncharacterized protein K460DRAFT_394548 [Cucurbitaria berberidis CBS 394.84]|uniref:Integral membrane protein n=1 Tax=Cucurbitaria berberidis CBS 394.84 TaxID=1168544 RepID=A0A9P4GEU0_9PLEO|nr:uncharacterized protein K460DRAFT_394548 [Cucurbitaria berberidis CBS 394.84]KAF1844723.1 hypothetical protein K460DRAFT_394548 [Cucurbitaria berberidis CBS 394.84]